MAWDDNKTLGDDLTATEWNNHVTDQKTHASRHETGGADELIDLGDITPDSITVGGGTQITSLEGTNLSVSGGTLNAASGGSGLNIRAVPQVASIYPSGGNIVYNDHVGESGATGETTYSTVDQALQAAVDDYDGNLGDAELGGMISVSRGEYFPAATIDGPTQGVKVVGARRGYNRSPSSAAGREWLTLFRTDNMPADSPVFNMTDADTPNGAKGSGVYGIDFVGDGRTSDTTTGVKMGEAGRTVVELCTFYNMGGNGVHAIDSFSAHVIGCQFRDVGVYDEDGGANETGTNPILAEIDTQNVNLTIGGCQIVQGPGAGTATADLPDDMPTCIRVGSGASVKIRRIGGYRNGAKIRSGVGDGSSAFSGTVACVKGEDLRIEGQIYTGENDDNISAIILEGGPIELDDVTVEKQGVGIEVDNLNEQDVAPWSSLRIKNCTVAGIRVDGATLPPISDTLVLDNAIGVDIDTGSFRFTNCRFQNNTTALDNDGADGGVESLVNCEFGGNTTDVTSLGDLTTNLESA